MYLCQQLRWSLREDTILHYRYKHYQHLCLIHFTIKIFSANRWPLSFTVIQDISHLFNPIIFEILSQYLSWLEKCRQISLYVKHVYQQWKGEDKWIMSDREKCEEVTEVTIGTVKLYIKIRIYLFVTHNTQNKQNIVKKQKTLIHNKVNRTNK